MKRLMMALALAAMPASGAANEIKNKVDPQLFKNTLLLQVLGSVTVTMSFNPGGTIFYADIHIEPDGKKFGDSHTSASTWRLKGNDLCVVADDSLICFENVARKPGEVISQEITNTNIATGKKIWSGNALMMLMKGRP